MNVDLRLIGLDVTAGLTSDAYESAKTSLMTDSHKIFPSDPDTLPSLICSFLLSSSICNF